MSEIKTWKERMSTDANPLYYDAAIQKAMQSEIDKLRAKNKELIENQQSLLDVFISSREEVAELRAENARLKDIPKNNKPKTAS